MAFGFRYLALILILLVSFSAFSSGKDMRTDLPHLDDYSASFVILDQIALGEGTSDERAQKAGFENGYDVPLGYGSYAKPLKALTEMTIGEIQAYQDQMIANGASSGAVGRYQITKGTLADLISRYKIDSNALFDASLQDKLAIIILKECKYSQWIEGTVTDDQFQYNLAGRWASVENPHNPGNSRYPTQSVGTTIKNLQTAMDKTENILTNNIQISAKQTNSLATSTDASDRSEEQLSGTEETFNPSAVQADKDQFGEVPGTTKKDLDTIISESEGNIESKKPSDRAFGDTEQSDDQSFGEKMAEQARSLIGKGIAYDYGASVVVGNEKKLLDTAEIKKLDCAELTLWAANKAAGLSSVSDDSPLKGDYSGGQWSDTSRISQKSSPSMNTIRGKMSKGDKGIIKSGPIYQGNYEWYLVENEEGIEGYVAGEYLEPTLASTNEVDPSNSLSVGAKFRIGDEIMSATDNLNIRSVPSTATGATVSIFPTSDELKPGDLLFLDTGYKGTGVIDHVAMYVGNDKVIHAVGPQDNPDSVKEISLEEWQKLSVGGKTYGDYFYGYGRLKAAEAIDYEEFKNNLIQQDATAAIATDSEIDDSKDNGEKEEFKQKDIQDIQDHIAEEPIAQGLEPISQAISSIAEGSDSSERSSQTMLYPVTSIPPDESKERGSTAFQEDGPQFGYAEASSNNEEQEGIPEKQFGYEEASLSSIDSSNEHSERFGSESEESDLGGINFTSIKLNYISVSVDNSGRVNFDLILRAKKAEGTKPGIDIINSTRIGAIAFMTGLSVHDNKFWVNLNPWEADRIIDNELEQSDVGRIMLEADLRMKKDFSNYENPCTNETGKALWDLLDKKREALAQQCMSNFPGEVRNVDSIRFRPVTRHWIIPDKVYAYTNGSQIYIINSTLTISSEPIADHSAFELKDQDIGTLSNGCLEELNRSAKEYGEYYKDLNDHMILPYVISDVNNAERYEDLRNVYTALALAQWYKSSITSRRDIFRGNLTSLDINIQKALESWNAEDIWNEYVISFRNGEYKCWENETIETATKITYRNESKSSGGVEFGKIRANLVGINKLPKEIEDQAKKVFMYGSVHEGNDVLFGERFHVYMNEEDSALNLNSIANTTIMDPELSMLWLSKGSDLDKQGRSGEAVEALDEAIRLYPKNAVVWAYKGLILNNLSMYDEAIQAFDESIKLDPKNSIIWSNKGSALSSLGRYNEAAEAFDEAIRLK